MNPSSCQSSWLKTKVKKSFYANGVFCVCFLLLCVCIFKKSLASLSSFPLGIATAIRFPFSLHLRLNYARSLRFFSCTKHHDWLSIRLSPICRYLSCTEKPAQHVQLAVQQDVVLIHSSRPHLANWGTRMLWETLRSIFINSVQCPMLSPSS